MKKHTIQLIALALGIMLLASCGSKKGADDNGFSLEGTLDNASNKTLYITEMTADNGEQFVDSIRCDAKGHFNYSGTMSYQTFYSLHSSEYVYIVLLPNHGEEITLTGDYERLDQTYMVNGSPESQLLWQIQAQINDANNFIHDLAETDKANQSSMNKKDYEKAHKETDSLFMVEYQLVYTTLYQFIEDNQGSLSTLYALDAPFNHSSRVFNASRDMDIFEQVLNGLMENNPDNPHTQYFKARFDRTQSEIRMQQAQMM
ncbi:MAG: DUF4369 domain-containing protein [Bacteroidales bacterium]|nr:DUF4369 domain-containing protein [Bacteroidales bacterium]